jgi:2',3'-cyclic-nucleotide 2'-phosphodiesterase/3'-nucleotidase/5'-nucleotidase
MSRCGHRSLGAALLVLAACTTPETGRDAGAADPLHLRVLATHDLHGALYPTTYRWSDDRPVGGVAALDAVMDTLEVACACPTVRLDGGDQMQGTLASNLTHGGSMVAALDHLELDAAAVGNHELDWGVDTLLARQHEADYAWLAANVFRVSDDGRPEWATPFALIERDGVRVGVIGYATASTPRTLRTDVTRPFEFRAGYAGIRAALEQVQAAAPDFVVIVAHAAGDCSAATCAGEMVDLAEELPSGAVHLIVGGHNHEPGEGVVNGIPIVRAGSNGQGVGLVDLYRHADGSYAFEMSRVVVYADSMSIDPAMTDMLAPYLRTADEIGGRLVTMLAEPLSSSAGGDRRLGTLIAEAARAYVDADFGLHNPGGVRIDLPAGRVTYADLHRVMPFDNMVVELALTGRQLRELAEQTGPRYYFANLRATYRPDQAAPRFGRASLTLADGTPIVDDRSYTLATSDFLADGGDSLIMLSALERVNTGVTVLDAVVAALRELPAPVTLPALAR